MRPNSSPPLYFVTDSNRLGIVGSLNLYIEGSDQEKVSTGGAEGGDEVLQSGSGGMGYFAEAICPLVTKKYLLTKKTASQTTKRTTNVTTKNKQ